MRALATVRAARRSLLRCTLILADAAAAILLSGAARAVEVCAHPVCAPWSWGWLEVPVVASGLGTLRAFGFEFTYNTGPLNFLGYRPSLFTRDFDGFDVVATANRIRVGGFDATPRGSTGTDTLVTLIFAVAVNQGTTDFAVSGFTDDLVGAAGCATPGQWTAPAPPPNGFIAVYPEGAPPTCCYSTPDGIALRVVARGANATADGILGAEFRIEVSPPAPGAVFAWSPDGGAATSVGNPVQNSASQTDAGVVIVFSECAAAQAGEIPLGRILVAGLSGERELVVRRHQRTATQGLGCAYFGLCGSICSVGCMVGQSPGADPVIFRARINSASCDAPCGYVATSPRSWSNVKLLYRDATGP